MDAAAKYQHQLLDQARQIYRHPPLTQATVEAFLAVPRHRFVRRYRERASREWKEVTEQNLLEHLPTLYADKPLTLFGDDDDAVPSTISQPSFVLHMLDLLQLQPGHRVFELGTGSGWNAALIGRLVGPAGEVHSLEIIHELAQSAADTMVRLGIENVHVTEGDGGEGYLGGAPYDRMAFTAGTYDLPGHFYDQIKRGGRLLCVIKNEGGGDTLFLLRKVADSFVSEYSTPCGFVPVTGKYATDTHGPIDLEALPEWPRLRTQVSRRPFWWGGKGRESFLWQTFGIRSFLGITEPLFRAFKIPASIGPSAGQTYFGLWDSAAASLVLAKDDELISYGASSATDRLLADVHRWIDLGMPTAASFQLRVYQTGAPLEPRANEWIVRRSESQFLCTLGTGVSSA
jgi:protein-L-isoaspartate(D-aspartate) O-methyltransferase